MSGIYRYAWIRRRPRARRGRHAQPALVHPAAIATRARVVSAPDRNAPVIFDTASSAQRRAATRSPSASAAWAFQMRAPAAVLGRRHSCAGRRPRAPRAPLQHRRQPGSQQPTPSRRGPQEPPAKLGADLEGRLGGRPGRRGVTLVCQRHALHRAAIRPEVLIVSCLGLCRPPRRIVPPLRPNHPDRCCALPRYMRHRHASNGSPIASARSRPSSAAARLASGSPAAGCREGLRGEDLA